MHRSEGSTGRCPARSSASSSSPRRARPARSSPPPTGRAGAAVGINVRTVKLAAFGLGSFIAGVAGALWGYDFGSVSATRFSALTALGVIAFAYLGGITMVSGAVFAGLISTQALFPHIFEKWILPANKVGTYTLLLGGLGLLINLILYPEGIAGAGYKKKQLKQRQREAGLPSLAAGWGPGWRARGRQRPRPRWGGKD